MKVLVDTPIWSHVLRRKYRPENAATAVEVASLMQDGRIAMIGLIRQQILSGVRERAQFEELRDSLRDFPDTEVTTVDYEEAASFYNECRRHGIQGSNTDFLICAVAVRNGFSIFTRDEDFVHFARLLPIALYDS